MDLSVKIGNLLLKNPVTLASGTSGYGEELSAFIRLSDIGAIFTKGLSLEPRQGNRGNRIMETPSGVLNSIGLENVGLECFLREKMPFLVKQGATVIPNVAGHSIEENVELCKTLSRTPGVAAVELNVSCPNVKEGGIAFGTSMPVFTELVSKVRTVTGIPLIIKLSPNVADPGEFALRAQEIGADAVSAVNTFLGMKIDVKKGRPHFLNKVAGLSGPAIRPMAVRVVYQIYERINIPIIGMGGIFELEDMLEFLMAGAAAVSLGTVTMVHPGRSAELLGGLADYMKKNSMTDLSRLTGMAHRPE
ncbi:MAG TPA: dihydroorotate dehydrogenase [Spirochaetota bacterium]|nr:dihydroorotate dehydrogenase [Spirochaetota bacterium]